MTVAPDEEPVDFVFDFPPYDDAIYIEPPMGQDALMPYVAEVRQERAAAADEHQAT